MIDNTSERMVQDALDKAKTGRTSIVISHRLSTIRNADLIIGLKDGEVVECGTHDELTKQNGLYYALLTSQCSQTEDQDQLLEEDEEHENVNILVASILGNH